jgi:hypothetical protein
LTSFCCGHKRLGSGGNQFSSSSYVEIPEWIYNKKATVNIKNEDHKCFKYYSQYHKNQNEITHHPEKVS